MLPVIGNYDAVGKETWLKRYTEMSNYGEYSSVLFLGGGEDNVEIGIIRAKVQFSVWI